MSRYIYRPSDDDDYNPWNYKEAERRLKKYNPSPFDFDYQERRWDDMDPYANPDNWDY